MSRFADIDRALLTRDQRQILEIYEQGFQSTFWQLMHERFQQRFDALARAFDNVVGEQQLGITQGYRRGLNEVLDLENMLEREFQALVAEHEAPEPEGPEFDDAWGNG